MIPLQRYVHPTVIGLAAFGMLAVVTLLVGQENSDNGQAEKQVKQRGKQAAKAGESVDPAEEPAEADSSILGMILDSGLTGMVFMAVLGICSIIAGTVAVERFAKLRREVILPAQFVSELKELQDGKMNPRGFGELCESSDAPISAVVAAGLMRFGASLSDVEKSLEDAASREMADIRARIRPLSTIGGIAPLVGLLGTVIGMIVAFHTASQAGLGKAELLAKGIYMALLTTAGGLSVAIPSLVLAAYFNSRAEKFFRELDLHLMRIPTLFSGSSGVAVGEPRSARQPVAAGPVASRENSPPDTRAGSSLSQRAQTQVSKTPQASSGSGGKLAAQLSRQETPAEPISTAVVVAEKTAADADDNIQSDADGNGSGGSGSAGNGRAGNKTPATQENPKSSRSGKNPLMSMDL